MDLSASAKAISCLEKSIELNLYDPRLKSSFIDMTPKHKKQEKNR